MPQAPQEQVQEWKEKIDLEIVYTGELDMMASPTASSTHNGKGWFMITNQNTTGFA